MLSDLRRTPNLLTLLRLVFIPFVVMAVLEDRYGIAFGLFMLASITDGLDGLLARKLQQKTVLGQYLDPIADKLLLSTMFLVLALVHQIPWKVTIVVFSRDLIILIICSVVYATTNMHDFRPSLLGKANTVAQVAAIVFVLLDEWLAPHWVTTIKDAALTATFVLTIFSGVHYVFLLAVRLSNHGAPAPPQSG